MEWLQQAWDFLGQLMNPESILAHGGVWLLVLVVFAETGLLVGFFLPGDSLLFISGVLVGLGQVGDYALWQVLIMVASAAICGDQLGYFIGRKGGELMLKRRKESFFFRREYVAMTKNYYDRYGGFTLVVGRFLPIVRTFAPVLAGVIQMRYTKFLSYSFLGGVLWVCTLIPAGYLVGNSVPKETLDKYHVWIVVGFIVLTTIPVVSMFLKERRRAKSRPAAGSDNSEIDLEGLRKHV